MPLRRALFSLLVAALSLIPGRHLPAADGDPREPLPPKIAPASDEAAKALAGFLVAPGLKATLVAAEPRLANPVAFDVDHRGRFWICESFRQNAGVTDNRGHDQAWLDDDLAAVTVADREAYHRKHLGKKAGAYAEQDDRLRVLEDTDGDGLADVDRVFADRFHSIVEGTGAGVLVRGNDVYYTNIPNLWRLRDTNGDGIAEERTALHTGYGVRVAFRGHDMHGLIAGPDGRIYYSIGDRGYNVDTGTRQFVNPHSGAVFRCELDGSNLEVFATGLRNPQELAFDDFGNLFTCDNNSDSGDRARWTYIPEGAEIGWRMSYQYFGDRGPWNREKLWHPFHEGQAAYLVPPITNFADGPSGLAYYPGTGLPAEYRGSFFLCDFRGGPGNSGVLTFKLKPKGASFELVQPKQFFWRCLVTDVAFGPDGAMYVTDWVNGWNGEGKGRLYRIADPNAAADPQVQEVKSLLAAGLDQQPSDKLVALLAHPDRRIRQEAQFALAARQALSELKAVAAGNASLLARVHAIWGIGQIGRPASARNAAMEEFLAGLLTDREEEVRAQAVRVLGDWRSTLAAAKVIERLKDASPRVQSLAALALGRIGDKKCLPATLELLAQNADADPVIRHAAVMALVGTNQADDIAALVTHPSVTVRVAAVVALRRLSSPKVAQFLHDPEERVVLEAARAIHDAPLADADKMFDQRLPTVLPQLAEIATRPTSNEALLRRALNANFRLGEARHAAAIARVAAAKNTPEAMKLEALRMLGDWAQPSPRDAVLGVWKPIAPRAAEPAKTALQAELPGVLAGSEKVRARAAEVAAKLGLQEIVPILKDLFADKNRGGAARGEALAALISIEPNDAATRIQSALADDDAALRAAALEILFKRDAAAAVPYLVKGVASPAQVERQTALSLIAFRKEPAVEAVLLAEMERLIAGKVAADTRMDVLAGAITWLEESGGKSERLLALVKQFYGARPLSDRGVVLAEAREGGDAERGRRIFFEMASASCVRCHKVAGVGGEVGPDLSKVAQGKERQYLLEAILEPSKAIAKGFESLLVELEDGRVVAGMVRGENDQQISLLTPDGKLVAVNKGEIVDRRTGKSAMPDDIVQKLNVFEVRDLVEYLSTLK